MSNTENKLFYKPLNNSRQWRIIEIYQMDWGLRGKPTYAKTASYFYDIVYNES